MSEPSNSPDLNKPGHSDPSQSQPDQPQPNQAQHYPAPGQYQAPTPGQFQAPPPGQFQAPPPGQYGQYPQGGGYPQGAYQHLGYQQPGMYPQGPSGYNTPTGPIEPPQPVKLAVNLMYVGAVLSLLGVILSFTMRDQMRETMERSNNGTMSADQLDTILSITIGFGVVFGILGVGLWVFNAVMNKRGKSWARILSTVLAVLGILMNLFTIFSPNNPSVLRGSAILSVILPLAILFLLWRPESSRFYEANSAPRY